MTSGRPRASITYYGRLERNVRRRAQRLASTRSVPSPCDRLPRDLVASMLTLAMEQQRTVHVTLTGPHRDGLTDVEGEVIRMERGRSRDGAAPDDEVTFTLVEHPRPGVAIATPPIALERVTGLQLLAAAA